MADFASIDIGDFRVDSWLSYRMDSNMLTPADAITLQVATRGTRQQRRELRSVLSMGAEVKAYIARNVQQTSGRRIRVLQHTGLLESRDTEETRKGTIVTVQSRDLAAHLVDSSVDIAAAREAGTNFVDMVRAVLSPWNIPVQLDAQASRHIGTGQAQVTRDQRLARSRARRAGVPIQEYSNELVRLAQESRVPLDQIIGADSADLARASARSRRQAANSLTTGDIERVRLNEARPQAGETVWGFIQRHANRFGLMMWFDPRGKLVISSPNYGDEPLFHIVRRLRSDPSEPNNILRGREILNNADRYSKCTVYGRTFGRDASRSRFSAVAEDSSLGYPRPLVIHDQSVRSDEEALRVAKRELSRHAMRSRLFEYTVKGHGNGQHLYAIDTIVSVYDEEYEVEEPFYCYGRTFIGNRDGSTQTVLKLMPIGAITL